MRCIVQTIKAETGVTMHTFECADPAQAVRQMTTQLHMLRKLAGLDFKLVAQSAQDAAGYSLTVGDAVEWFTPGAIIRARPFTVEELELINRKQPAIILRPGETMKKARIG